MASNEASITQELLARAHSPDNAQRIFSEKIQYRPLFLRPNSPPPSENARQARRKAREDKKKRAKALKPQPLSSRERRKRGLYNIPKEGRKFTIFEPLNRLWNGYMRETLGNELHSGGQGASAKLAAADYHGARVEVSRSRNPGRVGIEGIVIKDTRFTFEIITKRNQVKLVPKEGTTFRMRVPSSDETNENIDSTTKQFEFEVLGDQFQYRPADRANKKFRAHYLTLL
jgi:ribonuclease P protein subunit POP4